MDWLMPVNEILQENITKLDSNMMPPLFKGDVQSTRIMQEILTNLVDDIGRKSSFEQCLNRVITNAEKLRHSPGHILYLLKEPKANMGRGEVIGMLKMGHKHLFVFDEEEKMWEVEPVCVLDFYVVPRYQRTGYGKALFEYMLHDLKVDPKALAIDGPSTKMHHFLAKNYGMKTLVRQNNNFAISTQFFDLVPPIKGTIRSASEEHMAVGRFAAPKPPSAIASVIHGGSSNYESPNRDEVAAPSSGAAEQSAQPPPEAEAQVEAEVTKDADMKVEEKIETKDEPEGDPDSTAAVESADNTKSPERPSTLSVEPVADTGVPIPAISPAGSTASRRDSQLTEQGYFDVKFYHNKLW